MARAFFVDTTVTCEDFPYAEDRLFQFQIKKQLAAEDTFLKPILKCNTSGERKHVDHADFSSS